jgi:GLPGLI family protein
MRRKTTLIIAMLLGGMAAKAQQSSGSIQYACTTTLGDLHLDNVPADIAALLPKDSKSESILYFTADNTLYEQQQKADKHDKDFSSADQGSNIRISISTNSDASKTYTDLRGRKVIEQKDFMGKKFLIEENMEPSKWKITGRQKMLLDYPLQEAISVQDKDTIIAWFCTSIPVSSGPMGIAGLPGIVLEASIGKGMTVKAEKVDLGADVTAKIEVPKKGKKVTREAFMKIVEEKTEELKQQASSNSRMELKVIR